MIDDIGKVLYTESCTPPQKVLVVEDNLPYANLLFEIISRFCIICKVVYSPITALELNARDFTTAIIDWNFPGQMTGIECGVRLREKNPEIRIIIHTGFTDITIAEKCRQLGFEIIPKP